MTAKISKGKREKPHRKLPMIKGMISAEESLRRLKKRRPDVYRQLQNPSPEACLAWNLFEFRHKGKMTRKALAKKSRVSFEAVTAVEELDRRFNPEIKMVQKLAEALGVKFIDLFQMVDLTKI